MKKFAFGKNWQRYLKIHNSKRLEVAKKSITDFMGVEDLKNKLFLDVGCGSGYFSLAAFELGADVISFDADIDSVKCCQFFKKRADNPNNWKIYQGSILDKKFLSKLPQADVVYSYGVLHHTGNMWQAMENIKPLVKNEGYLYIAIYNTMHNLLSGSKAWQKKKQIYNRLPKTLQCLCEGLYILRRGILPSLMRFRNPVKHWKNYYHKRGESYIVDLKDWLGGYPYEYARPDEVFNFYKNEYTLVNLLTKNTLALNAFLFKKKQ